MAYQTMKNTFPGIKKKKSFMILLKCKKQKGQKNFKPNWKTAKLDAMQGPIDKTLPYEFEVFFEVCF